jgi:hypothetical protein
MVSVPCCQTNARFIPGVPRCGTTYSFATVPVVPVVGVSDSDTIAWCFGFSTVFDFAAVLAGADAEEKDSTGGVAGTAA